MSMFDCTHCGDRHHVNDFCATGPMSAEPVAPTTRETADHAELARLAEAATPGGWNRYVSGAPEWKNVTHGLEVGEMGPLICGAFEREEDCRFVEAAQPSIVLSLLSEIAALRKEVERVEADRIRTVDDRMTWTRRTLQAERQRDEARDTIASTVAKADWMQGCLSGERAPIDRETIELVVSECRAYCHLQALANQGADHA